MAKKKPAKKSATNRKPATGEIVFDTSGAVHLDDVLKLKPSETVRTVITIAQELSREARGREPMNSALFILAMIECGRRQPDGRTICAYLWDHADKNAFEGCRNEQFQRVQRRASRSTFTEDGSKFVSQGVWRAFTQAAKLAKNMAGDMLSARHLLAAFLLRDEEETYGVIARLRDCGFEVRRLRDDFKQLMVQNPPPGDTTDWSSIFKSPPAAAPATPADSKSAPAIGSVWRIEREAGKDEWCLKIKEYAAAIASLFEKADDEEKFSFGVFGHWGRGKTYLTRRVAEQLDNGRYSTAFFSAWKYRSTPEVWVHLYESIVATVRPGSWFLPLRVSLARIGPWPAIFAIFALSGSLLTIGEELSGLRTAIRILGVAGLIYIAFVYWRMQSFIGKIKRHYFALPQHQEKLGLQASLGGDLRSLLVGWRPERHFAGFRESPWKWFKKRAGSVAAIVAYCGCSFLVYRQLVGRVRLDSLDHHLKVLGEFWTAPWESTLTTEVVALMMVPAWSWVAIVAAAIVLWRHRPDRRVLLVVDDLDRCHPDEMLEIIESLLLLLDDDEVSRRLQVCMLVDETALKHALLKKYGFLTEDGHKIGDGFKCDPQRIIRENLEKFFLVHLRLPPVNDDDLKELMQKFLHGKLENSDLNNQADSRKRRFGPWHLLKRTIAPYIASRRPSDDSGRDEPMEIDQIGSIDPLGPASALRQLQLGSARSRAQLSAAKTQPTVPSAPVMAKPADGTSVQHNGVRLTDGEKQALLEVVAQIQKSKGAGAWGPRAVKSLIFRYQFARLLLQSLPHQFDPKALAHALAGQTMTGETNGMPTLDPTVAKIVQQVL